MTGPVASPAGLVHQADMIARLFPDRFVLMLLGAILLGWLMPASGGALDVAQRISNVSIFALFFLHGLRLPRKEVLAALKSWKLQAGMLAFIFLIFPLAGWGIAQAAGSLLPVALLSGVMYCAMLPSTVQSAISYSSMANGNIAASVVGAAISNLLGIIATPLLVAVVIGAAAGVSLHSETIMRIATMLLLPFALGQFAQSWMGAWAVRQKRLLSFFDRLVIVIAVYVAFSAAVASGSLAGVDGGTLLVLMLVIGLLLLAAFAGSWALGHLLGLDRADRTSLIFAGAHKSIATGAPMAAILFGSGAGLILLPAILYHMAQLLVSAPIAARLAKGS
ncbi:MAG: bile acid:sodium symporter family protein [Sphingomonadales bacterium]|jgi:sodium/bile acid cotransporter 7